MNQNNGFSIVEIIVVLGIVSVLFFSVGRSLGMTNEFNNRNKIKLKAAQYNQEAMEIILEKKDELFSCKCDIDTCINNICTRASDGQNCNLLPAYNSCWTEFPENLTDESEFVFKENNNDFILEKLNNENKAIENDVDFERKIIIININSNFGETNEDDYGVKEIKTQVIYNSENFEYTTNLKTIATAWKNL